MRSKLQKDIKSRETRVRNSRERTIKQPSDRDQSSFGKRLSANYRYLKGVPEITVAPDYRRSLPSRQRSEGGWARTCERTNERACVPSERTYVLFSAREVLHARVMHYINRQWHTETRLGTQQLGVLRSSLAGMQGQIGVQVTRDSET